MTNATMTREDERALHRLRARLEAELAEVEAAGLEDRANRIRSELEEVDAKLEAERLARQAAESARRQQERERDEEKREREAEKRAERERAERWLQDLFSDRLQALPREEVFTVAEEDGVDAVALVRAAHEAGFRELGFLKSGTGTLHDPARGRYWGRPERSPGMVIIGPPKAP